ncbi:hypothetical protein BVX94_00460 [bacterium B17]|nr:hypothetical protein BVX94_00460 [bacterium B17]
MRSFLFLLIFLNAVGVCSQAYPLRSKKISVRYLPLEEVAKKSKALAHVKIKSISAELKDSMVYTVVQCAVLDAMGSDLGNGILEIRQPGGSVGNLHTWSGPMPNWRPGEEWIFGLSGSFSGSWTVVGIKQGAFRVDGYVAERDFEGFAFLEAPPASVANGKESFAVIDLKMRLLGKQAGVAGNIADVSSVAGSSKTPEQTLSMVDEQVDSIKGDAVDEKAETALNRLPSMLFVLLSIVMIASLLRVVYRGNQSR